MERKKIHFKREWYEAIISTPEADVSLIIDAVFKYYFYAEQIDLPPLESVAFKFIKLDIDSNCGLRKKGAHHWNWKGGITDKNRLQRNSGNYKHWRRKVFERDEYTCMHCGQIGGILNAHHIKPFCLYPDLRFDVDNGITLCKKCHNKLHKKEREWERIHS